MGFKYNPFTRNLDEVGTGGGGGGSGTVTSVGLSLPSIFSVSGSPVTTSGTLTGALATQSAATVFAGPASGSAAVPTFRALVATDIPTIPSTQVSGLATVATSGAYADLLGRLVVSSSAPAALGATAAAGTSAEAARTDHVHQRDADVIVLACSDETTALTTGANRVRFRMPYAATLLAVRANVNTAPTGSALIVDINEAGVSVLGTKLSIDATEFSSTTAASAATITDSNLADDAEISIDIDQVGSTVAGTGLKVMLSVRRA